MVSLRHVAVIDALLEGTDDVVPLQTIEGAVEEETSAWWHGAGSPSPGDVKAEVIRVCTFLLESGLMRLGDLSDSFQDPDDLIDWTGAPEDIAGRLDREWDSLDSPDRFSRCWLKSTAKGVNAGRELQAERRTALPDDPDEE